MINFLDKEQLQNEELTISEHFRLSLTDKEFAVIINNKLRLVKDKKNLDRLFLDRLKAQDVYNARVYPLK